MPGDRGPDAAGRGARAHAEALPAGGPGAAAPQPGGPWPPGGGSRVWASRHPCTDHPTPSRSCTPTCPRRLTGCAVSSPLRGRATAAVAAASGAPVSWRCACTPHPVPGLLAGAWGLGLVRVPRQAGPALQWGEDRAARKEACYAPSTPGPAG